MSVAVNMSRKQIMLGQKQRNKLSRLSASQGKSESEIVRLAIEAFDPNSNAHEATELMELVSERLQEAIHSTKKTNRVVAKTLKQLRSPVSPIVAGQAT
ncbi:MAG: hypothetical protein JKY90_08455 [Gammaproteobacteria bacterium]|nr:hypothetical protein [Gammaproteobacteria bacterium]